MLPQLTAAELEHVIKLVGRSPRHYAPRTSTPIRRPWRVVQVLGTRCSNDFHSGASDSATGSRFSATVDAAVCRVTRMPAALYAASTWVIPVPPLLAAPGIILSLIGKLLAVGTSPSSADCGNADTSVGHLSWTVES
jgi:hypothetical protein